MHALFGPGLFDPSQLSQASQARPIIWYHESWKLSQIDILVHRAWNEWSSMYKKTFCMFLPYTEIELKTKNPAQFVQRVERIFFKPVIILDIHISTCILWYLFFIQLCSICNFLSVTKFLLLLRFTVISFWDEQDVFL